MTIANMSDPNTMTGAPVTVSNREKLGRVDAIYFDNATDKPEWAAVKSGLFASRVALVPLAQGTWNNGTLTVPFGTDALKAAPRRDLTGFPDERTPQPPGHRRQDRGLDDESEHPDRPNEPGTGQNLTRNRHDELTATPVTFLIKPEEGLQAT